MIVRERTWELTGWRASLVGLVLLAIPVGTIFGAGFLVGRII